MNIMSFSPTMGEFETMCMADKAMYLLDPADPLFEDESYLDLGIQMPEPGELEVSNILAKGALMHRFGDDEAVHRYCEENYLEQPIIHADGKVSAYCAYTEERLTVGWTR